MSADVLNILGPQAGIFYGPAHSQRRTFPLGIGSAHVVRIGSHCVPQQLSLDSRSPSECELQVFQHKHSAALGRHKAVTLSIKGA